MVLLSFVLGPIVIVTIYVLYILWYQKYSKFFKRMNEIPGAPGYPIIGNIGAYYVPYDDIFYQCRKLNRTYYPVYKDWTFRIGAVSLQHPDDVEVLLSSTVHIDKSHIYDFLHPWLGSGLLTSGGTQWQSRRKILTPAFHFSILQEFVKVFIEETDRLVKNLSKVAKEPYVDVIPLMTQYTLASIAESSMGINLDPSNKESKDYKTAIHNFGETLTYRIFRPWLMNDQVYGVTPMGKLAKKSVDILHAFSRKVIKERKMAFAEKSYEEGKRLAMLDLLLSAQRDGFNIDDEGIREEVDTFMFEGHDTTAVAICWALLLLANNRDVQDTVYHEICEVLGKEKPNFNNLKNLVYMERVIKECLRLYPSVPLISRIAKTDMKIPSGYVIPKGALVHLQIYDLHHNPELYPDPEKFDPDRFLPEMTQNRHPFAYVPFSAGPRNCIGQRFAILELKTVLCGILRNFVLEQVDRPCDVKIKSDMVLRALSSINVKFRLREQS